MDKKSIPPEYWWGWKQSGYAKGQTEQRELEETLPPSGLTTNDATAVKEMEESAFVTTTLIPAQQPSFVKVPTKYPDIQGFGDIDDDIKQRIVEAYKSLFEDSDKSKYRRHEFEVHRQDILRKLQSAELKEPVIEAKRRNEMMKYGMSLAEESQLDWEATVEETLGFELPEEERFVGKILPPAPPPGPEPGGRGAFFVLCDGCHVEGSLVPMFDGSVKCIEDVEVGEKVQAFDGEQIVGANIISKFEYQRKEYVDINAGGYSLRVTPSHKLFVVREGFLVEIFAKDLRLGDKLLRPVRMLSGCNDSLTSEQSHFLGGYTGDGHYNHQGHRKFTSLSITDKNRGMLEQYCSDGTSFGLNGIIRKYGINGRLRAHFNSASICPTISEKWPEIMRRSPRREIPLSVMQHSNGIVAPYLRGLFDSEGSLSNHTVELGNSSERLVRQVQLLLLRFGIRSSIRERVQLDRQLKDSFIRGGRPYWSLQISGIDIQRFSEVIGFAHPGRSLGLSKVLRSFGRGEKSVFYVPDDLKQEIQWLFRSNDFKGTTYNWNRSEIPRLIEKVKNRVALLETADWQTARKLLYFHVGDIRRKLSMSRKIWSTRKKRGDIRIKEAVLALRDRAVFIGRDIIERLTMIQDHGCMIAKVLSVKHISKPVRVYDIGVAHYSNNFIGGILGHNSGSMEQPCDLKRGFNRFQVASGVIWTFIQEAKAINRGGKSHYIGIYGFDSCMYYPLPVSEYPPQPPLNPLPSDDILTIERDFLRYWPSTVDSREWMGNTQWEYTLPAYYADYMKFRGGDLIIICDGDVNSELSFFEGAEAGEVFDTEKFSIPKDKDNPTFLMKLQDFIDKNDCGTGYMFWLVPKFTPQYTCPKCKTGTLRVVGIKRNEDDDVKLNYRCGNGHEWSGDMNERCAAQTGCQSARSHGGFECASCRYFHLVLGKLFSNGNHIFKGTTANELLDSVAAAITDQRKRRLERGEVDDFMPQDDEED